MMPAMSPMMTEGTVTTWKKREGEAFAAGDVLLQIESDIAIIDVEANNAGILGKILVPDGTSGVPVEQILALVARDEAELAHMQGECRTPTPIPTPTVSAPIYNPIPDPPSLTMGMVSPSPIHLDFGKLPLASPRTPAFSTPRTPSLFEMQSMGAGHRSIHSGRPRPGFARKLTLDVQSQPSPRLQQSVPSTPKTAVWPLTPIPRGGMTEWSTAQTDGAAIRRIIVSNLSSQANKSVEYFDEVL